MNKAEALLYVEGLIDEFHQNEPVDGRADKILKVAKENPNNIFALIEFKTNEMRKMGLDIELLSLCLNRAMSMELEQKQAVKRA